LWYRHKDNDMPDLPQMTHPMDSDVGMWLASIYQVDNMDSLDPLIVDAYRQLRTGMTRINAPAAGHAFIMTIIAMSGVPIPEKKTTFVDYIKAGQVKLDDDLMIKFRAKWEPAKYIGYRGGMVLCDQGGKERQLDPSLVKFPELATA
jgi:hypothetical protein